MDRPIQYRWDDIPDGTVFVSTYGNVTEYCDSVEDEITRLRAEIAELKRLKRKKARRNSKPKRGHQITAINVPISRNYQLRGQALFRPCLNCGYEPKKITLADGSQEE